MGSCRKLETMWGTMCHWSQQNRHLWLYLHSIGQKCYFLISFYLSAQLPKVSAQSNTIRKASDWTSFNSVAGQRPFIGCVRPRVRGQLHAEKSCMDQPIYIYILTKTFVQYWSQGGKSCRIDCFFSLSVSIITQSFLILHQFLTLQGHCLPRQWNVMYLVIEQRIDASPASLLMASPIPTFFFFPNRGKQINGVSYWFSFTFSSLCCCRWPFY